MPRFMVPFRSRQMSDPFNDLHREMNRLFDDFMGFGPGQQGGSPGQNTVMAVPRLDVRESQDAFRVCVELPGVQPSDVDLRIDGNLLTISGEKKNESEQDQQDYHVMERSFGRFQRTLQLPFEPDPDQVKASFEHGVLTVSVPKQAQQEKARRIEIQAGGGSEQAAGQRQAPMAERVDAPATGQQAGGSMSSHH